MASQSARGQWPLPPLLTNGRVTSLSDCRWRCETTCVAVASLRPCATARERREKSTHSGHGRPLGCGGRFRVFRLCRCLPVALVPRLSLTVARSLAVVSVLFGCSGCPNERSFLFHDVGFPLLRAVIESLRQWTSAISLHLLGAALIASVDTARRRHARTHTRTNDTRLTPPATSARTRHAPVRRQHSAPQHHGQHCLVLRPPRAGRCAASTRTRTAH